MLLHALSLTLLLSLSMHISALPTIPAGTVCLNPQTRSTSANSTLNGTESATSWQEATLDSSIASASGVASSGISQLLNYLSSTSNTFTGLVWWQSGSAYSAIISYDLATSSKTFSSTAGNALSALINAKNSSLASAGYGYNDDSLWWANACLDAYDAYGNDQFRQQAADIWKDVYETSQIKNGVPGKARATVASGDCAARMEGGVYWSVGNSETYVNSITTSLFLQVSARLSQLSSDATYKNAGQAALEWLQRNAVDSETGLVLTDGVKALGDTCKSNAAAYTYNTGVYMAGLVLLDQIDDAEKAAKSAMETTEWTDGQGHITEEKGRTVATSPNDNGVGFRSIMLRDMMQVYRATSNDDLKAEIRGFVNTNYNMLYGSARQNSDYDVNWWGPFTEASVYGQLAAADLLVSGMVVN